MDKEISKSVKGKEKAKDKHEGTETEEKGTSLVSKVVASASGLARDLTNGANGELGSMLASSSAIGGKSQSSNAADGNSAWRDQVAPSQIRTGGPSQISSQNTSTAFRSLQTKAPVDPQVNEFLSDSTFNSQGTYGNGNSASTWTTQFKEGPETNNTAYINGSSNQPDDTFIPEIHDGAEVSQLLSDPTFSTDSDVMDMNTAQDLTQEQVNDLFPQEFTDTEQHMVDYMQSNLPPPPTHKPETLDDPRNLQLRGEIEILTYSLEDRLKDDGIVRPTIRVTWYNMLDDVLWGYTDQVWGELLPEVKTARKDLENMRVSGNNLDAKAIARLKMILDHVRG